MAAAPVAKRVGAAHRRVARPERLGVGAVGVVEDVEDAPLPRSRLRSRAALRFGRRTDPGSRADLPRPASCHHHLPSSTI